MGEKGAKQSQTAAQTVHGLVDDPASLGDVRMPYGRESPREEGGRNVAHVAQCNTCGERENPVRYRSTGPENRAARCRFGLGERRTVA